VIIGAGISGLTCASTLQKKYPHLPFKLFDSDHEPGGRIQTDKYRGFLLDRGFQIFIEGYPEANRLLGDVKNSLDLKRFDPGAMIIKKNGITRIADPLRQPSKLLETVFSPVGTFGDKLKVSN
jgi:protoporphyrinogen oxidase